MHRTHSFTRAWLKSLGLASTILLLGSAGCFGSHYRASYSMADVQARPASLLVAQKIQRPLYLRLDPAQVPDTWEMKESSSMNPTDGPHFQLQQFQRFVSRDLKDAMGNYFSRVEVVRPGEPLPSEPHVVADIKVDRVQLHSVPVGRLTYTIIEMTWGMGLRPSESAEYAFTFAGEGKSSEAYPTFEAGCAQLIESAITGFNKSLVEKGGLDALRHVASADKAAAPAATPEAGKETAAAPEKDPPAAEPQATTSSKSGKSSKRRSK